MNIDRYNGGLTREQFLYHEIKTVAQLTLQYDSRDKIIEEIEHNNLFQFPTERMIKTIAKTCFRRIDAMDSDKLLYYLATSSSDIGKQINLYAIMCENTIVFDFMTEVIGEKYRTQTYDYSAKDMNIFFIQLNEKAPDSENWSEATVKKIKQVLNKFLVECGYLENVRSKLISPVYLFPELEEGIRASGNTEVLPAFNCFT